MVSASELGMYKHPGPRSLQVILESQIPSEAKAERWGNLRSKAHDKGICVSLLAAEGIQAPGSGLQLDAVSYIG